MFPRREDGLCVEVSEDGRRVLVELDNDHAAELARVIATVTVDRSNHGGDDAWLMLAQQARHDTWLGTMLRLMACSQNLRPGPSPILPRR